MQFPWRLLLVVEFAAVTALAVVSLGSVRRPKAYFLVAALIALAPGLVLAADDTVERVQVMLARGTLRQQDVKEYEPKGYPQPEGLDIDKLALEPVLGLPLIECRPTVPRCTAIPRAFGDLSIYIDADRPTTVILRRFFFPMWQAAPLPDLRPTPDFRLVSFRAPPGQATYTLAKRPLAAELWGGAISLASIGLLLAWAALERRGIKYP